MVVMDGFGLFWIINWRPCIQVAVQKVVPTRQVLNILTIYMVKSCELVNITLNNLTVSVVAIMLQRSLLSEKL